MAALRVLLLSRSRSFIKTVLLLRTVPVLLSTEGCSATFGLNGQSPSRREQ
jgi:hypothetical protein